MPYRAKSVIPYKAKVIMRILLYKARKFVMSYRAKVIIPYKAKFVKTLPYKAKTIKKMFIKMPPSVKAKETKTV